MFFKTSSGQIISHTNQMIMIEAEDIASMTLPGPRAPSPQVPMNLSTQEDIYMNDAMSLPASLESTEDLNDQITKKDQALSFRGQGMLL